MNIAGVVLSLMGSNLFMTQLVSDLLQNDLRMLEIEARSEF